MEYSEFNSTYLNPGEEATGADRASNAKEAEKPKVIPTSNVYDN